MSTKKRHDPFHFVVDEDLGKGYFKELALDDRFTSSRFEEYWDPGTPDSVWIPEIHQWNVIVITHDSRLRRQHRDVVVRYNARLIVSVGATDFKGQATWFRRSWPQVERFLTKHHAPFIARFRRPAAKEREKRRPRGSIVLDDYFKER